MWFLRSEGVIAPTKRIASVEVQGDRNGSNTIPECFGIRVYRQVRSGKLREAAEILLTAAWDPTAESIVERGLWYHLLYQLREIDHPRIAFNTSPESSGYAPRLFESRLAFERCEFREAVNMCKEQNSPLAEENFEIQAIKVLALTFQGDFSQARSELRSSLVREDARKYLESFISSMEGKTSERIDTVSNEYLNTLSRLEENLISLSRSDLLPQAAADSAAKNNLEDGITSHIQNRANDDSENIAFLLKKLTQMKDKPSLQAWNIQDYIVSNLLILYTRMGAFQEAAKLLSSCDQRRLNRCFQNKDDLDRLINNIRLYGDSNPPEALEMLVTRTELLISEARIGSRTSHALLEYSCLLGQFYYDNSRFAELNGLIRNLSPLSLILGPRFMVNAGHSAFIQEKYADAVHWYRQAIEFSREDILSFTPAVLANLCASLIRLDLNEEAEDIFETVKTAESAHEDNLHSTVINLVIGFLYCSQRNFDFGLERVFEAFGSDLKSLAGETWFYAKTALMALADVNANESNTFIQDTTVDGIFSFLDKVITYPQTLFSSESNKTIQEEAGVIRNLLAKMYLE